MIFIAPIVSIEIESFSDLILKTHESEICDFCEDIIIEGSSNCYHYQCEGRHCEDALLMFMGYK